MYRSRDGSFVNKSPWEIGLSHYDQRDLFTQNARIDDGGYGRGPSVHPPEGSYAYPRDLPPPSVGDRDPEHVAWPILRIQPDDEHIAEAVTHALAARAELRGDHIEARVASGIVTLTGTVEHEQHKHVAVDVARAENGVADVVDDLRVRGEPWDPLGLAITGPLRAT